MSSEAHDSLFAELRNALGTFDELVVHRQRGRDRKGFALLLLERGDPRSFVKIRSASDFELLLREEEGLSWIAKYQPHTFSSPGVMAAGETMGWHFLALEPLPVVRHTTPKMPPLAAITQEIGVALENLAKPEMTPAHWSPMHGDLTPWNLRSVLNRLTLLDWEHVGWGPPGADRTLYHLAERELRLPTGEVEINPEAHQFWLEQDRLDFKN